MDSNITVETVLQDNGFKVDSYEDPILALKNFKSCFYDLVILDIKMPQMNGFLVYREIKKLDERIKVCFHSKSNSWNIHLMVGNLGLKCILNYSYVQYSFEELG